MGITKKVFGCLFLVFGCFLLAHTFMDAPYGRFEVAVGYIVIGVFFAVIFIYVGSKWTNKRIGGVKND